jgi:hypothetical protein
MGYWLIELHGGSYILVRARDIHHADSWAHAMYGALNIAHIQASYTEIPQSWIDSHCTVHDAMPKPDGHPSRWPFADHADYCVARVGGPCNCRRTNANLDIANESEQPVPPSAAS